MARNDELIVGLDIGTTKICAVVAEARTSEDGERSIDVIGIGTHPSKGLRKGVVVDIDATVDSIRKAVDEAELMAGCESTRSTPAWRAATSRPATRSAWSRSRTAR